MRIRGVELRLRAFIGTELSCQTERMRRVQAVPATPAYPRPRPPHHHHIKTTKETLMTTIHSCRKVARLMAAAASTLVATTALAQTPTKASPLSVDTELRLVNDLRNRGISDSLMKPAAKLTVQAAHESGVIGELVLTTVSKKQYLQGNGLGIEATLGYHWGDPERWWFGVGATLERFLGARFEAPHAIDLDSFTPADVRRSKFDSDYLLLEAGYGALEARVLSVVSRSFHGANTGGVCGQILQISTDPAAGLGCYARGDHNSRGTLLADLSYSIDLDPHTTLNLSVGVQKVKNFREADATNYSVGISHRRWGFDFGAEWVGVNTRVRELYLVPDGDKLRATDNNRLVFNVARKF
jgi:hypothetical protein